jgi:hypothetical protein
VITVGVLAPGRLQARAAKIKANTTHGIGNILFPRVVFIIIFSSLQLLVIPQNEPSRLLWFIAK